MCCSECCTCSCCDNDRTDNMSLPEFLDSNDNEDSSRLDRFLTFVKGYTDPMVNDPSYYTKEKLTLLFNELRVI